MASFKNMTNMDLSKIKIYLGRFLLPINNLIRHKKILSSALGEKNDDISICSVSHQYPSAAIPICSYAIMDTNAI